MFFLKKKIHKRKSGFDAVTKIHFQFWQPLQQEHQPPPVLSWGLWGLKTRENKFHQPQFTQDNTKPSTPNRDELTIIFIITFKFRLYPLEVNSATISSTSSPSASSSSTSSSWSSSASSTQKEKKSFSKWILHF